MRKFYQNIIWLCLSLPGLVSCLEINEITFIDLKARFLPSASLVQLGTPITFNQQSTAVASQFIWDFGDGTSSTEESPQHTYDSVGRYTVKLISIKADGITKDSTSQEILVIPNTDSVSNYATFGDALSEEIGFSLVHRPNNGYLFAGRKNINTLLLIRTDENLQEIWRKEFNNIANGRGQIFPMDVISTIDNGFMIAGFFEYNINENDGFVLKISENGDELWTQYAKTQRDEKFNRVIEINGLFLITGTIAEISSNGNKTPSLLLLALEGNGDIEDLLIQGSNWTTNDFTFTFDGGFAFAVTEGDRPRIFKFDPSFAELQKFVPTIDDSPFEGKALGIVQLDNGDLALVGEVNYENTVENATDSSNAFIAVFDEFGSQQWIDQRTYYHERYLDVIQATDGSILAVGTHQNPLSGKDILVGKYSLDGSDVQVKLIGGTQDDEGFSAKPRPDGAFSLIGSTRSFGSGLRDFYFIQLNADLE
ncbi:MAG: PKD domain-containing protein [Microscillaceae bacterium]|nr:PKD domain-containing protein [Microscillaceae bacterium]